MWKDVIVPEAFAHPAKMAYGLLSRILSHAQEQGWLTPESIILDPFGGIGSTGILGAYEGYQVVCVELEAKFVRLAEGYDCPGLTKKEWLRWFNRFGRNPDICPTCQGHAQLWYEKHSGLIPSKEAHRFVGNFELHDNAWQKFGNPRPIMLQGDSRKLVEVVQKADLVLSSPPYAGQELDYGDRPNRAAKIKDNPNFQGRKHWQNNDKTCTHYGSTPGQLGAMKAGDLIISSPPFSSPGCQPPNIRGSRPVRSKWKKESDRPDNYGQTSGNLGNLKSGDLIISSPPYEEGLGHLSKDAKNFGVSRLGSAAYGKSDGQLGIAKGETFWSAARLIVEQCHQILRPGGHAIWVCKDFVRNKKRVPFSKDWSRLCESVGFKLVHWHKATLVKETKNETLFGHTEVKRKERKSFFRRLAESKGSPRIDEEDILCMERSV